MANYFWSFHLLYFFPLIFCFFVIVLITVQKANGIIIIASAIKMSVFSLEGKLLPLDQNNAPAVIAPKPIKAIKLLPAVAFPTPFSSSQEMIFTVTNI